MKLAENSKRFGVHKNAFGFLRLLFASLVIITHVSEWKDGDSRNDLLYSVFGTISFGPLAVCGFFIVSGYLITASYQSSEPRVREYFIKRIARIYPGFVVAYIASLWIFAPMAGFYVPDSFKDYATAILRMVLLSPPEIKGIFPDTPFPGINPAMWTIAYEFRCYVLVAVMGAMGAFKHKWTVPLLAASLMSLHL